MFRKFLLILVFVLPFILPSYAREEGFIVESIGKGPLIEPRKILIRNILSTDTMQFGYTALKIILDMNQKEPRGKMQGKEITLSPSVQKESEFVQLFTHELSHYIDIYYLSQANYRKGDPSSTFYSISWESKTTKKSGETLSSFVSGYAATNQYEDFAESLTFYVFHNDDFRDRALKNDSLRLKYLFISNFIFTNTEFQDTDFSVSKVPSYLWDTTKVPISVKKYLYSLG